MRGWSMTPAFPRTAPASPGVARQYSGTLGKVANCQIGVSVQAVTDAASCPLDWRLFLPERWDDSCATDEPAAAAIRARRARARMPHSVRHRGKGRGGPGMPRELARVRPAPPVGGAHPRPGGAPEVP